ncbi:MAG: hypothetical protein ABMA26_13305 [Limisphaerales bacterium]
MNPSEPIVIPPELADVPLEYRAAIAVIAKHMKGSAHRKELAHIPERHRAFVAAFCFYKASLGFGQKSKRREGLYGAAFVAALFAASIGGLVAGFSVAGERGGLMGATIGFLGVLVPAAGMMHRHGQRQARDFFNSEECRSFIEKLK